MVTDFHVYSPKFPPNNTIKLSLFKVTCFHSLQKILQKANQCTHIKQKFTNVLVSQYPGINIPLTVSDIYISNTSVFCNIWLQLTFSLPFKAALNFSSHVGKEIHIQQYNNVMLLKQCTKSHQIINMMVEEEAELQKLKMINQQLNKRGNSNRVAGVAQ